MNVTNNSLNSRLILQVITGAILLVYPIVVYFGLKWMGIELLAPLLIIVLSIRLYLVRSRINHLLWLVRLGIVFGIILSLLSWLFKTNHWLLYYPVVVNLLFLVVFCFTLFNPPTLIERFARLTEPDLPEQAIAYTRKVTLIWCLFFIMNGAIALLTILVGNLQWWMLYNGAISYILMGTLMGGEWIVRKRVQGKNNHAK